MHKRWLILGILLTVARSSASQDVRTEVVEHSTGRPISGAVVSVIDEHGASVDSRFTDQSGRLTLQAPANAKYRVRADKVGYETWTSVVLQPSRKQTIVRIGMFPTRASLQPTVVRSGAPCDDLGAAGTSAASVWAEMRKALVASALTESQGLVAMDVEVYERILDRDLHVVSEQAERLQGVTRVLFRGVSAPRQSESPGLVEPAEASATYTPPTATTLASDQFVKAHCFSVVRGYGREVGLLGLEFKPAKLDNRPDFSGVLWLDPTTNSLRYLAFDYVNLPVPLRIARARGRVDFQQLPAGQWIIPRWHVTMPRVARLARSESDRTATARDTLLGYRETGGTARPHGSGAAPPAAVTGALTPTEVTGVAYDSTTGLPLQGVEVSIGGGRYRTSTNAAGRFVLPIEGSLADTITFAHPRLTLLRVPGRVQPVSVTSGTRSQASVWIPSYSTLRTRLCGQRTKGPEAPGLAFGHVRDAAGNPVHNASVSASWQVRWIEQGGRLVSTNQHHSTETDTATDGSYFLCGFNRGAVLTARVSIAGRPVVQETITLPQSMVLERDFRLPAR